MKGMNEWDRLDEEADEEEWGRRKKQEVIRDGEMKRVVNREWGNWVAAMAERNRGKKRSWWMVKKVRAAAKAAEEERERDYKEQKRKLWE